MPLKGAIMHFDIYNRHYNTILLLRIITLKFGGRDINKFLVCFIAHFKKLLCNAFYPLRIMILIGIRNRDNATQVRAVSIYGNGGSYCSKDLVSWIYLILIIIKSIPFIALCLFKSLHLISRACYSLTFKRIKSPETHTSRSFSRTIDFT